MPGYHDAPSIHAATADYERWLGRGTPLIAADLARKHETMRADVFGFFRGSYYRWAQRWATLCPEVAHAPHLLAVGDLHVANFGTWRDAEGRLAWGINDLDEAWTLPFTNDLVRLAASARLAVRVDGLRLDEDAAADAILDGYREALASRAVPFVLAEAHPALHRMAMNRLKDPEVFWDKLRGFKFVTAPVPAGALAALRRALPTRDLTMRIVHRIAGVGSLGRPRYVAIAEWHGGLIAREAKPIIASAAAWAAGKPVSTRPLYADLLSRVVRCPDPFLWPRGRWVVRRLAPDCSRIDLDALPRERDEARLMHAMGREVANVHVGSLSARKIDGALKRLPSRWLRKAAARMTDDAERDWRAWRTSR